MASTSRPTVGSVPPQRPWASFGLNALIRCARAAAGLTPITTEPACNDAQMAKVEATLTASWQGGLIISSVSGS